MKRICIITLSMILSMPIYLHAQTAAPRRPLNIDTQATRKDLLQLRDKLKAEAQGKYDTSLAKKPSQK